MTEPVQLHSPELPLQRWLEAQRYEESWWGRCVNTFAEERRQIEEAKLIGLNPVATTEPSFRFPVIDMKGLTVLDVGGGPVSLLLKCVNLGLGSAVLDPCRYPAWVWGRYQAHGLELIRHRAEELERCKRTWDEVWLINVLQHVTDPEEVVYRSRDQAGARSTVRCFEWIDVGPYNGHPHRLEQPLLDKWFGGHGTTRFWRKYHRRCWYGTFSGR